MKQKDNTIAMVVVGVLLLAAVWVGATQLSVGRDRDTGYTDVPAGLSCPGIASVTNTITARDNLRRGTAATGEFMHITTDNIGPKAFGDVTGLTPAKAFEALLSFNGTSYFAQKYNFATGCANEARTVYLASPQAPSMAFTNENGVTLNSASAREDVAADQTYTAELTIRSPGGKYSSLHGAVLVAEWDKTYVRNVEVNGLSLSGTPTYLSHTNLTLVDGDTFRSFLFPGELKDGERTTVSFTFETTSETPTTNSANIKFHWIPRNLYIDDRTLQIAGPSAENRNNEFIGLANTTAIFYTE
jgi:hypothetical protein